MKKIEDIEKLSEEQLLEMCGDTSIEVPQDLEKSLLELAAAASVLEEVREESGKSRSAFRWAMAAALAAVLALGVTLAVPRHPKDTFSDPYLAYAEVQKTMDRVSRNGETAARIAGNAVPVMEKTEKILNVIAK